MLIRHAVEGFAHRVLVSKAAIFVPRFDALVPKHRNVLAVLGCPGGKILIPASNIVTDAGDIHYSQAAVAESVTNVFGTHVLASAGTPGKSATYADFTPIANTAKANSTGYPKRNDGDTDNTGAGANIVTHLASYAKADFNATGISHGMITNTSPTGTAPLLTGYAFGSSFDKTSNDTLKVFVNHEFLGS